MAQISVQGCLGQGNNSNSDFIILNKKTSTSIPFELEDNRIFVNVKINGQGPFHFILDSGAGNVLTPQVAEAVGLKLESPFQTSGVGENLEQGWRTSVSTIDIGDIRGTNQNFVVVSFDPIKKAIGFKKLDGLIGFELFSRFVAKIDYENNSVDFASPENYKYAGNGLVVPFHFNYHIPEITGEIDGIKGNFIIDTGDRSSLTLFVPFIDENNLRVKYAPPLEVVTGWGIGGPIKAQVTRIKSLKLGDYEVRDIATRLPLLKSGAFTQENTIGSIGTGVLKKFNVIFDYSRHQLILEKNSNFTAGDDYDCSGMWLSQNGENFQVLDIAPESPASIAGLHIGDQILAVNGIKSAKLSLPQVRTLLSQPQKNPTLKLTIKIGDQVSEKELKLRILV